MTSLIKSNFAVCLLSCSLVTIITIIISSIGNRMVVQFGEKKLHGNRPVIAQGEAECHSGLLYVSAKLHSNP